MLKDSADSAPRKVVLDLGRFSLLVTGAGTAEGLCDEGGQGRSERGWDLSHCSHQTIRSRMDTSLRQFHRQTLSRTLRAVTPFIFLFILLVSHAMTSYSDTKFRDLWTPSWSLYLSMVSTLCSQDTLHSPFISVHGLSETFEGGPTGHIPRFSSLSLCPCLLCVSYVYIHVFVHKYVCVRER